MKKNNIIWNYIDMLITILIFVTAITSVYFAAEALERYIYRYTIFPLVAFVLIFILGIWMGRGIERTRKNKPIGILSKKMNKVRKHSNMFIFSDEGEKYVPHKEIIDDLKSGEIVHVKQYQDSKYDINDFNDMYKVHMNELVDNKMEDEENEEKE